MLLRNLRIAGFKSFVSETLVPIEKGITVIVGPNGCGKSNIVEAMRWVMGEASAKRMRADEMDDVIFSGAPGRSKRDFAEVALVLDNSDGSAPPPYQQQTQLEVCRRIDRGRGSFYRINGDESRAKDVQFLFADQGSGASSSAIVGQGRITSLLESRPTDRRFLLEEAAGIRGLQGRKHESELKLLATEANLQKLQDILDEKALLNKDFLKQARDAEKYRELSDDISFKERLVEAIAWRVIYENIEGLQKDVAESLQKLTQTDRLTAEQTKDIESLAEQVEPLRNAAAAATAQLREAQLQLGRAEDEERRLEQELRQWQERHRQAGDDATHAEQSAKEASEKQKTCRDNLASMDKDHREKQAALKTLLPQLQDRRQAQQLLQSEMREVGDRLRQSEEKGEALRARLKEWQAQGEERQGKIAETEAQLKALDGSQVDKGEAMSAEALDKAIAAQEKLQNGAVEDLQKLRSALSQSDEKQAQESVTSQAERASLYEEAQTLQAEAQFLQERLSEQTIADNSVIRLVQPKKGYETAIAALLGDAATAGLSAKDKAYWNEMGDLSPVDYFQAPDNLPCAADMVKAPQALARRLRHSFIADDLNQALKHLPKLQAGQAIVTKDGGLCRWDGYVKTADKISVIARNLQDETRLGELQKLIADSQKKIASWEVAAQKLADKFTAERQALLDKIQAAESQQTDALGQVKHLYDERRRLQAQLSERVVRQERLQDYRQAAAEIEQRRAEAEKALAEWQKRHDSDKQVQEKSLEKLQAEVVSGGEALETLQSEHAALQGEVSYFDTRRTSLMRDAEDWATREKREHARAQECLQRVKAAAEKITEYEARPNNLQQAKADWLQQISEREASAHKASEALTESDNRLRDLQQQKRDAEREAGEWRERHAAKEADLSDKRQALGVLEASIEERFLLSPSQLLEEVGEEKLAEGRSDLDGLRGQVERLKGRREALGTVNLVAHEEAEKLAEEIATLESERADLDEAVRKLRLAISRLNAKARERLKEAFRQVNENFSALFERLFGGGSAELQWVGDDDVLLAGLEIMVTPPGKQTRLLSLLSGGEQSLTAMALLFAVFVSRPSLICVLDEVDALLDDNNVSRFCDLLVYLRDEVGVKFLIVSHHRLTMARADRLYGVTMAERGVSSLVSVDMETAERYREKVPAE